MDKQINIGRMDFEVFERFEKVKFMLMKRRQRSIQSTTAFLYMLELAEKELGESETEGSPII